MFIKKENGEEDREETASERKEREHARERRQKESERKREERARERERGKKQRESANNRDKVSDKERCRETGNEIDGKNRKKKNVVLN